jgi:RNA polymerase sigma-70 factor (ECF subfamily)
MELTTSYASSTPRFLRASIVVMSVRGVGDQEELDRLYRAHHALVFRLVSRLGVRAAHAEDVTHDVFLAIAGALERREPVISERAWVAGVARNVVLRHRRDVFRFLRRREAAAREALVAGEAEEASDTDAILTMQTMLAGLPEDQRVVFVLMELEDWSAPEVAETLGIKLPTVYSRQRAARLALEQALRRVAARDRRLT